MQSISSADLVALLDSLDAPIVITKNKKLESSWTFRQDPDVEGCYLDGFWTTRPAADVEVGHGYVLHHVVHESVVWLGAFGGLDQDEGGKCSYIIEAAMPFLLSDLSETTPEQRALWGILKKPGPVVSCYIPRGIDGEAPSIASALAKEIKARSSKAPLARDLADLAARRKLTVTQRQALVNARMGQGPYKVRMLELWDGQCAVTGIALPALLIASHAKPWRMSTDDERLDPCNGLPLIANLDRLFDQGLIAFDPKKGNMLVSSVLSAGERKMLGVPAALRKKPNARQAVFLRHHLKNIFVNGV